MMIFSAITTDTRQMVTFPEIGMKREGSPCMSMKKQDCANIGQVLTHTLQSETRDKERDEKRSIFMIQKPALITSLADTTKVHNVTIKGIKDAH